MKPTLEMVKDVRERTGLAMMDIAHAFAAVENANDVYGELRKRGLEIVERRKDRVARCSRLHSYIHNGKFGAMIRFGCETDFVARSDEFKRFMQDICMHVAATPLPNSGFGLTYWNDEIASQSFVKDVTKTVADVVAEISAVTGEKVEIGFVFRSEEIL